MNSASAPLIERDTHMRTLGEDLDRALDSAGRLVIVSGEAGVGKTSLLRKFVTDRSAVCTAYWGSCDALSTPRPLGPLQDIAARLDSEIARQMRSGVASGPIFSRLLGTLEQHAALPVLVLEDVHWADTSTLDLVKFLGRRITSLRALILLTLRSDEVARGHPIWRTLGEIPPPAIRRLEIEPLTLEGVRQLVDGSDFDAEDLYRLTGGNPFFLSELLATTPDGRSLPVSIRDALRARRGRIGRAANSALDVISIFPSPPPDWLLARLLTKSAAAGCDECVAAGLLVRGDSNELFFKHELARHAVLDDVPERTRKSLHARAVSVLKAARKAGRSVQNSTIIHHASGAGDGLEVLRLAPLAASDAASVGSHAQAAAHLSAALAYVAQATPEQAAELYESWSYEAALAVKIDDSTIDARHKAIELWRSIGRQDKVGLNLRWLARLHWYRGESQEADKYLSQALAVLEALPPGPELAMAYAIRSQMLMLHRRTKEAVEWGNRAIDLARACNATETLVHALNTVGTARLYADDNAGMAMLDESLTLSLEHGLHEQVARAFTNITSCATSRKDFGLAEAFATRGIKFNTEHDVGTWVHSLYGYQAQVRLDQGRLTEARDIAQSVLQQTYPTRLQRMVAANVLALARSRLGEDPDDQRLEAALADANSIGELQYLLPSRLALIETAWIKGETALAQRHSDALRELPLERLNTWNYGDASVWLHRTGVLDRNRASGRAMPMPRQLELAGRHGEAADVLLGLGMHYDAALVLAHADDDTAVTALPKALTIFEGLGAKPAADFVRRRAAGLGMAKSLPRAKRGPYAKARSHPLGLTGREVQILRHVKDGLSNREISAELKRSERTVEHHISAVLAKLSVRNRIEALIRIQTEPWLVKED